MRSTDRFVRPVSPAGRVPLLLAWILLALPFAATLRAHGTVRFDGGLWWREGAFEARTVWSVDGVLADSSDGPPDAVVDLGGARVVPPLGDAHTHALGSPDFAADSRRLLTRGVLYARNPNSLSRWLPAARAGAAAPGTVDVAWAGGGLTSPGGHPAQIYERFAAHTDGLEPPAMDGDAFFAIEDAADLARTWPRVLAGRPDFVKVYLEHSEEHAERRDDPAFHGRRGLDPMLVPEVVRLAAEAGLPVSAHVTTAADLRTAVDAGVAEIAHLPLEPLTPADAEAAAAAEVRVVTTATSHRDTSFVADLDGVLAVNLALLDAAGVSLVLGTDGEATVLDEALKVQELTGWSNRRMLELLTRDTPRSIFPERAIGSLEPGAEASFVAVAGDPLADLGALRRPVLVVERGHALEAGPSDELPGVANALAHVLLREGAAATLARFDRLRAEESGDWDFGEPQLNAVGYFALEHGRPEEAVAVFRRNTELFPRSANVWDSLGDGLAAVGDSEAAAEAYREALRIAPDSEATREKLEALASPPGAR